MVRRYWCFCVVMWLLSGGLLLASGCEPRILSEGSTDKEVPHLDAGSSDTIGDNTGDLSSTDDVRTLAFTALTFNVGTTIGLAHDKGEGTPEGDGYTSKHAQITDELYENSLSWNPAEQALIAWLAKMKPDIATFQELYYDPWCKDIKVDPALDFVCQMYTDSRSLQIRRLLGPEYSIACAEGQDDNCVGVHKRFGTIVGCEAQGLCLGGLKGTSPPNKCSRGARVGAIEVKTVDGRSLTIVVVHGTSGIKDEDMACRTAQFRQIFADRGDGKPAASGTVNLVLGDLNTDPFLRAEGDPSAAYWNQFVGAGKAFQYISDDDPDGPRTYGGLFRIDHIVSDVLQGKGCTVAGVTEGVAPVLNAVYWDHKPILCQIEWPR